ncbi:suppressor of fused domain protein [bacterium]|nr:suppressor of fused domain protein [bacterium]
MTSIWSLETDFELSGEEMLEAVQLHLERHMGEHQVAFFDADGWAGLSAEDGPPIDVLVVPPEGERRFAYVCSFGASLRSLDCDRYIRSGERRRVEFVLAARQGGDAEVDARELATAANAVRRLAKIAHLESVVVEPGEVIEFGDWADPMFGSTGETACAFIRPRLPASGFEVMTTGGGARVDFLSAVPVTRAEQDFSRRHGPQALAATLARGDVTEMLDPGRACTVRSPPRNWRALLASMMRRALRRKR